MNYLKSITAIVCIAILALSCSSSRTATSLTSDVSKSTSKQEKMEARKEARQQLLADLDLREDQKMEVQTIVKESQEKIQAVLKNGGDRRAKMQQMRMISQNTDAKLKEILDASQYATYEKFKEKQREQMREQMQNRGGRGGNRGF